MLNTVSLLYLVTPSKVVYDYYHSDFIRKAALIIIAAKSFTLFNLHMLY